MNAGAGWLDFLDLIGDGIEGIFALADYAPLVAILIVAFVLVWLYRRVRAAQGAEVVR